MSKLHSGLNAPLAVVVISAAVSLAQAQATRTWVSGIGDDVNPCSRTSPCKTFAGAFAKTAPGGTISVIDAGSYGAVVITKAVSIVAEGAQAGIQVSAADAITISAGPNDVVRLHGV